MAAETSYRCRQLVYTPREPNPSGSLSPKPCPTETRRSRTLGSDMTLATVRSSLALVASGMPFGPKSPYQKRRSTSAWLTPASFSVGTLGSAGERALLCSSLDHDRAHIYDAGGRGQVQKGDATRTKTCSRSPQLTIHQIAPWNSSGRVPPSHALSRSRASTCVKEGIKSRFHLHAEVAMECRIHLLTHSRVANPLHQGVVWKRCAVVRRNPATEKQHQIVLHAALRWLRTQRGGSNRLGWF